MEVDEDLIRHVARLARLELTPEEIARFTPELKEVITTFSQLSEENTSGIRPSFQPIEIKNHMRDDEPEACLSQKQALENSKHNKDGYFMGPRAV
jgi:aspartyl-tRNA(Asn)/glutamyl-tRNA(Gln) amidotransferase subunit C